MKTKHYITPLQYANSKSTDVLHERMEFLQNRREKRSRNYRGCNLTDSEIFWDMQYYLPYNDQKRNEEHNMLLDIARIKQSGIDLNTGINLGINMLYVKI